MIGIHLILFCITNTNHLSSHEEKKSTTIDNESCKTLWFASMSVNKFTTCSDQNSQNEIEFLKTYEKTYAASIESLISSGSHRVLQPVLILHEVTNRSIDDTLLAKYAKARGVIVLPLGNNNELSFQSQIDEHWQVPKSDGHRIGPFIRLDMHRIFEENKLFDINNTCQKYALYTDSDVIFPNEILREDLNSIKENMAKDKNIIMYGPQQSKKKEACNTGVMFIDVPRFGKDLLPKLIQYLVDNRDTKMGAFDQGWINTYFSRNRVNKKIRGLLPFVWNWKVYWPHTEFEPLKSIKVIHFHGPKPDRGLEEVYYNGTLSHYTDKNGNNPFKVQILKNRMKSVALSVHAVENGMNKSTIFLTNTCSSPSKTAKTKKKQ